MIDPHRFEPCSLAEGATAREFELDATADFGEGAVVVECSCGSWIVESADGGLVAWSEPQSASTRDESGLLVGRAA